MKNEVFHDSDILALTCFIFFSPAQWNLAVAHDTRPYGSLHHFSQAFMERRQHFGPCCNLVLHTVNQTVEQLNISSTLYWRDFTTTLEASSTQAEGSAAWSSLGDRGTSSAAP